LGHVTPTWVARALSPQTIADPKPEFVVPDVKTKVDEFIGQRSYQIIFAFAGV